MSRLPRLLPTSLGRRILLLHGVNTSALVLVLVGFLRVNSIQRDELAAATAALAEEQAIANRVSNAVMRQIVAASYYTGEGPDEVRAAFEKAGEEAYTGIRRYLFRDLTPEERLQLEQVKEQHQRLEVTAVQSLELTRRGQGDVARPATDSMISHALALQDAMETFLLMREEASRRLEERQSAVFTGFAVGTGVLMALVLLGSLVLGRFLKRRLATPLSTLKDAAGRIGAGDLSVRVPDLVDDEFAAVSESFNGMVASLAEASRSLEQRNGELEEALETLRSTRDELLQSEKLSAVGRMMAGLAHELNNPMASVLGFAELLAQRLDEGNSLNGDVRKELVEPILHEGMRARSLIRNLLRFSRKSSAETGPVNLAESIGVVASLRKYAYRQAGLTLAVEDMPETWVVAESQRLQQILLNIINNALDAMAMNGSGALRIRRVPDGESVMVALEDDGPGLEEPDRIFEPFFTTKAEDEGTGLGLALVRQFMEEFGGAVEAANRQDSRGARFLLRFRPASPPPAGVRRRGPERRGLLRGAPASARILVVEDEPALRKLQERILGGLGADILMASSGKEAREILRDREVDVVVSDLKMPGGTGLDLYRWIIEEHPHLERRFIFVTGDVTDPELADFAERAPNRIVHKPFQFDDYLGKVVAALG